MNAFWKIGSKKLTPRRRNRLRHHGEPILAMLLLAASAAAQAPLPAAGNVALSLDEYNRLVELAGKPPKKSDAPPLAFSIQRAGISLQVAGESASATVQLDGEVFATGPVKAPLVAGMTVLDARRAGSVLPLMLEGGSHVAVLNGPSEFHITLDAGLPVLVEAGRASVTIPVPAAGVVRLTLTIPGEHTNVNLTGGLITSRASSGGKTTIEATLIDGSAARVWWATREAVAPVTPKDVRFLADVKTLVTVGEAEVALAALAEVTVVQGEPAEFQVAIPAGWEVTGATGGTLESSGMQGGALVLKVNGAPRTHAFLITMERAVSTAKVDIAAVSFAGAQRETGEIVVEGEGTMELAAKEIGGVKRMDVKEASAYLRSMTHRSVQAAFRYHRQPGEAPGLALDWTRFPDTSLLAAVAQSATVTTLVTSEGRSLTEVKLMVRNREQPFLKVALPAGASIVSAEVAGEAVKPAQGADGARVPLLRTGFRPADAYEVSFVMTHAGTPFANKGGSELALPKMDVPIGLMEWEVFLPARYRVKDFGGDAVAAGLLPRATEGEVSGMKLISGTGSGRGVGAGAGYGPGAAPDRPIDLQPGMMGGYLVDASGATVANAQVTVTHIASGSVERARTDSNGRWVVLGMRPGTVQVEATSPGFHTAVRRVEHVAGQGTRVSFTMQVGATNESVEVNSNASGMRDQIRQIEKQVAPPQNQASVNVTNLQRRVAGVLPIQVDVPKAGNSYRFTRALVLDEETKLTFSYKAGK